MRWIGHAGLAAGRPGGAPDLACLDAALGLGLDRLEVDVCVTADGVVVLHHDAILGDGTPLSGVDLATARAAVPGLLDLEAAAGHLDGRLPLLLDLKGAAVVEPLSAWLAGGAPAGLAVCADDPRALLRLAERAPGVARWRTLPQVRAGPGEGRRRAVACLLRRRLAARLAELAGVVGAAGVCVDQWAVSRGLCAAAHGLGLEVAAWTVNHPLMARVTRRAGVDLLTTDHPAAMRRALGEAVPPGG